MFLMLLSFMANVHKLVLCFTGTSDRFCFFFSLRRGGGGWGGWKIHLVSPFAQRIDLTLLIIFFIVCIIGNNSRRSVHQGANHTTFVFAVVFP